jgi:hypothetical protein
VANKTLVGASLAAAAANTGWCGGVRPVKWRRVAGRVDALQPRFRAVKRRRPGAWAAEHGRAARVLRQRRRPSAAHRGQAARRIDLGLIWAPIRVRRALTLAMRSSARALPLVCVARTRSIGSRSCSRSYGIEEVGLAMPPLVGDL